MKWRPMPKYLLVAARQDQQGGLYLPEGSDVGKAKVIAVGDETYRIRVGDIVLYRDAFQHKALQNGTYLLHIDDVFAVSEEE